MCNSLISCEILALVATISDQKFEGFTTILYSYALNSQSNTSTWMAGLEVMYEETRPGRDGNKQLILGRLKEGQKHDENEGMRKVYKDTWEKTKKMKWI